MSGAALAVAAGNARRHGVADRAEFVRADWLDGIDGPFDLIVSNPPYIPRSEIAGLAPEVRREPEMALSPGPDGLEACRAIADGLGRALAPRGRALIEIGAGQGPAARAVFEAGGAGVVSVHPDVDGRDRVVEIRPIECVST
jgi:release factor glutamine methyltransferase